MDDDRSRESTPAEFGLPDLHITLYHVLCDLHPEMSLFLTKPISGDDYSHDGGFLGSGSARTMAGTLRENFPHLAFAAIRSHFCNFCLTEQANNADAIQWEKSVQLYSRQLIDDFETMAAQRPKVLDLEGTNIGLPPQPTYDRYFIYRHRAHLKEILSKDDSRRDIAALLGYIENEAMYAQEIKNCDLLFEAGLVDLGSIRYLFQEGDVVVYYRNGKLGTAVLVSKPLARLRGSEVHFDFRLVRHECDGGSLVRIPDCVTFDVTPPSGAIMRISDLVVYPLEFAPDWARGLLRDRGWNNWVYWKRSTEARKLSRAAVAFEARQIMYSAYPYSAQTRVGDDSRNWPRSVKEFMKKPEYYVYLMPADFPGAPPNGSECIVPTSSDSKESEFTRLGPDNLIEGQPYDYDLDEQPNNYDLDEQPNDHDLDGQHSDYDPDEQLYDPDQNLHEPLDHEP
ncbi:hypothetical protein B0T26DRAFT_679893 [Lasiosphaeria miniovina]|uniref:Uncharacterized protein n=1 Tax=Lasiosphaeria miniovina TaxID=1954250 RepID=A0AA39ZYU8_9PEZI|nr:uncharacterized protein B0T26DRAFT_679893 [Lasiosphaeria miniovina]KAK0706172.1 hypothetical protein B0T26DRAFT_679893 [Lasiosphaeria miniovina]